MKWFIKFIQELFAAFWESEKNHIEEHIGEPEPEPELQPEPEPVVPSARERLYEASKECIGIEVSPDDLASDEVACVESLENILYKEFGFYVGGDQPMLATWLFIAELRKDSRFEEVDSPLPGDIIISPTGSGNGKIRGHTGIVGKYQIMSNNSFTSLWDIHFTLETWERRYTQKGGMRMYFFRINV